jgi:hypothetical protein
MRNLELERDRDEERKRKRRKEEEATRLKEKAAKEKTDRERAIKTIKEQAAKRGWLLTATGSRKFNMVKGNDRMIVEVLKNGDVNLDTPGTISTPNHKSAEDFQGSLAKILVGKWKTIKHHFGGAAHAHGHTHTHSH